MLKDVTLGRYYMTDSILHRLDPRTKMVITIAYIVMTFFCNSILTCALSFAVLCLLVFLSKVPLKYMVKGLRAIFIIVLITDLINIFFVPNGLWKAFIVTLRMVEIVFASNLLALTTKPKVLAEGIEKGLGWMKALHVPVHDFATMICIAFRFLPILTQEADRVMEAQKARGADFESGNLIQRAKALMPILIPLFASAFRRADELSQAMDSRLYGSGETTSLHPLNYDRFDALFYIESAIYIALVLCVRRLGL